MNVQVINISGKAGLDGGTQRTGFNLGEEHMNLFYSDFQVIAITPLSQITTFSMLNSIYIWKNLKDKNKCTSFNVDFLGYLSHLKHILKIEENICSKNNEKPKFDKFNIIYENL